MTVGPMNGSQGRLVDEAYGTMGSNGSSTIRSSGASTGRLKTAQLETIQPLSTG